MSFCFETFCVTEAESIYACGKIKTESGDFKESGSFPDNTAKVAINNSCTYHKVLEKKGKLAMKMKKDQKYSKVESLIYNYYSKTRSFSCVTGNYGSKKTEIMHDTFLHYFFDFTKSKSIIGT